MEQGSICSEIVPMQGLMIDSGTPEGVGPVVAGDKITSRLAGLAELALSVGAPG